MINGIKLDSFSKTFQDAVRITRILRIRGSTIRYLWIDSLCILQDDLKDWESHGSTMPKLYSMATITISASSSPGPDIGCLIPWDTDIWELNPCKLQLKGEKGEQSTVRIIPWSSEQNNFHLGPLSARGWCFQERELSAASSTLPRSASTGNAVQPLHQKITLR